MQQLAPLNPSSVCSLTNTQDGGTSDTNHFWCPLPWASLRLEANDAASPSI